MENAFVGNGFLSVLSNSAALKLLLVALVLFVSGAVQVSAEEARPYKATTADECIAEKECVGFVFLNQIYQNSAIKGRFNVLKTIDKLQSPLKIKITGDKGKDYEAFLVQMVKEIAPVFPYKIIPAPNDPNFTLVVTEKYDDAVSNFTKSINLKTEDDANDMSQTMDRVSKNSGSDKCFSVRLTDKANHEHIVSFVNAKSQNPELCMAYQLYSAIGFAGKIEGLEFGLMGENPTEGNHFTKLDQFLIFLLYQDDFKNGQSQEDVLKTFQRIYGRVQEDFNQLEGLMDND